MDDIRYWTDDDYRVSLLGTRPEQIPAGIGAGLLDVMLDTGGTLTFWRCVTGNDGDGYHRAQDFRAVARAWLMDVSEQRDLVEAMRQAGATSWCFRYRRHGGGLLQTQAALRRDHRALTTAMHDNEW